MVEGVEGRSTNDHKAMLGHQEYLPPEQSKVRLFMNLVITRKIPYMGLPDDYKNSKTKQGEQFLFIDALNTMSYLFLIYGYIPSDIWLKTTRITMIRVSEKATK